MIDKRTRLIATSLVFFFTLCRSPASLQSSVATVADKAALFEQRIAPLLARHCLECHTASNREGGLDLSQKQSATAGGESGLAIAPGNSDQSLLWEHVSSDSMPKDRPPLSSDEKSLVESWINAGAPWTLDTIDPFAYSSTNRAGYDWWSLQPVQKPPRPSVQMQSWPLGDIDYFVLARLESAGLKPGVPADRRTLIRRLYFDLIGLPPDPVAVERFVSDPSPDAYENLVSELLDSPHYGERWARHWLDVVRFGESQGFERNRIRENAWRYRDWVIQSLNRDLPYDEFVRQQIAGDVFYPDDLDALIATGYHVCGTWDQVAHLEGSSVMKSAARQEHMEDLVATLGQAFIGLTVNCARCHDHKFDPISQVDYFSIAALLGGVTQQQDERRDIKASRDRKRQSDLEKELADLTSKIELFQANAKKQLNAVKATEKPGISEPSASKPIDGLLAIIHVPSSGSAKLKNVIEPGMRLELVAGNHTPFQTPEPPKELIKAIQSSGEFTIETWISPSKLNQSGPARIVTLSKDSGQRNFTLGQDGDRFDFRLRTTNTDGNGLPSLATPSVIRTDKMHVVVTFDSGGILRIFVDAKQVAEKKYDGDLSSWDSGFQLAIGNELTGDRPWEGRLHRLAFYARAIDAIEVEANYKNPLGGFEPVESWENVLATLSPTVQQRYKAAVDRVAKIRSELDQTRFEGVAHVIVPQQPPIYHVLARGDINKPGEVVVPKGLSAIARSTGLKDDFGLSPDAPEAIRRKSLALWLSDPKHPLTSRVMVNRVWHYHFGKGIVDTPSDFGYAGGLPSHPELLDYLAATFIENRWSLKSLHRMIVSSATYRQSSQVANEKAESIDSDNRLLWRFKARQLEGEAVRDAILAVSGALNPSIGGPSYRDVNVKLNQNHEFTDPTNEFSPATSRRTIYRLWARSGAHPLLQSLDCPDPSVMMPNRPGTITPLQALSLMNNVFVEKCAESFAGRVVEQTGNDSAEASIALAYQLALARQPTEREAMLAGSFIQTYGMRVGLKQLCLVLLNTNEFIFIN
jgi:cytochrome c553